MGKFANDPKVYDELNASVANLNAITTKLKNGEGSLGQLLNDPAWRNRSTRRRRISKA